MDAAYISTIIEKELTASPGVRNWHGITTENIRQYLVPPHQEEFQAWNGNPITVWVVLDEIPDEPESGYLVVFNSCGQKFGLALKPSQSKPGTVLGFYGTFLETLAGM